MAAPVAGALLRMGASLLSVGGNVSNGLTKLTGAMSSFSSGLEGALQGFGSSIKYSLKDTASLWKDYNDQAVKNVRQIGLSVKDVNAYQKEMMVGFKHLTAEYGITIDQLLKQQQSVSDATQKARILGQEDLKNLAAMNKLIGEQATQESIRNFDRLGGSLDTATAHMAKAWGMARRYGLNAQQASETFAKNIKLAESYTFANGIQGIAKMTLLSQKLKFDMEGVAKAAESNFGSVESAIESSAKLQMLGGNMGALFSNPMDALYESINDMEGFTERVIAGASQRGYFNAKTGMFEMNGLDKMFLKEQAKALGMSYNDLFQMASQSSTNKYIETQLRGKFTEEQKAYVTSNAQYDTDKQKHYITRFNPVTHQNEKVYVENLTASLVAQMQDLAAPEQVMQGDVADIKYMLMDYFHTSAQDLVSLRERETGIKEGFNTAKAEAIDKPMRAYQWAADNFAKGGLYRWLLDNPLLVLGGSLLGSGISGAWRGIKNSFFGNNNSTPTMGGSSGSPVRRSYKRNGPRANVAEATGTLPAEAAEGGRASARPPKTWAQKAKGAFKKGGKKALKLAKKGGKFALIATAIGAVTGLLGGGGEAEEAYGPEGEEVEGGGESLSELKKQTLLLEKLTNLNADQLYEERYGDGRGISSDASEKIEAAAGNIWLGASLAQWGLNKSIAGKTLAKHTTGFLGRYANKVGENTLLGKSSIKSAKFIKNFAKPFEEKIGANLAGKLGGKLLVKGANIAGWGGLALDGINMLGQSKGWWKANSATSKWMDVGASAATGAGLGSFLGAPGALIGGAIGGVYGIVKNFGKDIAKGVKKTWGKIKNFFSGEDKAKEIEEKMKLPEFETQKFGETRIDDPQLFEKAALSVISIHDFLISKLGDKNNAAVADIKSKAAGALGILGGPLAMAGNAVGGLLGGAGSAVGSIASGAGTLIKNVVTAPFKFIGGLLGIGGDNAEAKPQNPDELTGTPLMEMAARATIDIKDTLNKIYVGGSVLFSNSIFGRGSGIASRIPEWATGTILSSGIANNIKPKPIGEGWFHNLVEPHGGLFETAETRNVGIAPIDINVNGTIKLDLGNNTSLDIDAKKLLDNNTFIDKIVSLISDAFQRNVAMGAGANRSNPARYGIGNTDVIAGRRR